MNRKFNLFNQLQTCCVCSLVLPLSTSFYLHVFKYLWHISCMHVSWHISSTYALCKYLGTFLVCMSLGTFLECYTSIWEHVLYVCRTLSHILYASKYLAHFLNVANI